MMKTISLAALVVLVAGCGETNGSTAGGGGAGGATSCPNDLPASCPAPAPKWSSDVAKVIEARCAVCHTPSGAAAGDPLTNHAEVFSRKGAVLNQIYACKMPPEGAAPLSATERLAIEGWLVCGAADD